jgi:hypothetical protein
MQSVGGHILVGADDHGHITGELSAGEFGRLDEANVRQGVKSWLPEPPRLAVARWQFDEGLVVAIGVGRHSNGFVVMDRVGNFGDGKTQETLFRPGDIFIREGTSTARASHADVTRLIDAATSKTTNLASPSTESLRKNDSAFFVPCPEGELLLEQELRRGQARGLLPWWRRQRAMWLGSYFAFWHMTLTIPCQEIAIVVNQGPYHAEQFGVDPSVYEEFDKATVVSMSPFGDDDPKLALYCGETDYGFARKWLEDNASVLLNRTEPPSVFGLSGTKAYPGIAGVHLLACTADGYILFALRGEAPDVEFHPLTWSASCEESISLRSRHREENGRRVSVGPDLTIADVVNAAMYEEWNVPPVAIERTTCLAVGREFVRVSDRQLSLSSSILSAARLSYTLEDVFTSLSNSSKVRNLTEHVAWMGVRLRDRDSVLALLRATKGVPLDLAALRRTADVRIHESSEHDKLVQRSWMPTSPARLYLGSHWLFA